MTPKVYKSQAFHESYDFAQRAVLDASEDVANMACSQGYLHPAHLSRPSTKIWRYLWIYHQTNGVNSYQDIKTFPQKFWWNFISEIYPSNNFQQANHDIIFIQPLQPQRRKKWVEHYIAATLKVIQKCWSQMTIGWIRAKGGYISGWVYPMVLSGITYIWITNTSTQDQPRRPQCH